MILRLYMENAWVIHAHLVAFHLKQQTPSLPGQHLLQAGHPPGFSFSGVSGHLRGPGFLLVRVVLMPDQVGSFPLCVVELGCFQTLLMLIYIFSFFYSKYIFHNET